MGWLTNDYAESIFVPHFAALDGVRITFPRVAFAEIFLNNNLGAPSSRMPMVASLVGTCSIAITAYHHRSTPMEPAPQKLLDQACTELVEVSWQKPV